MGIRTPSVRIAAIAAVLVLACLHPLSAFAQDDAARAEAIAQADAQMEQITHVVQLALERYRLNHQVYPAALQPLMDEGYLSDPPANPYFGLDEIAPEKALEEELKLRATPGAVVYHPFAPDGAHLTAYILLAAGTENSRRLDLFYGEPHWDTLHYLIEGDKRDGRPERYIILLSTGTPLRPDVLPAVMQDPSWMASDLSERAGNALFAMQLAVERYSVDHDGVYPPDLQTVVDDGYVYWPASPYWGVMPGAPVRLQPTRPGKFIPGGLVYEPHVMKIGDVEDIAAYILGLYGINPAGGQDVGSMVDGEWRFYDIIGDETTLKDGVPDGIELVVGSGPAPEDCPGGV